ncbi:MAG: outer membrane beta-barrel protein [Kiritimatiellae bacterium]|nr:outer membrane beta-barrel protein [Kiritimatiellia bacterium]
MKKILMVLMLIGLGAVVATAGSGVGIYGSYFNADDPGPGFGGGIKFKTDLSEYFGVEARASCITQFDEDDTDDGVYLIPLEAGLLFNLPLQDSPLNLYGGGGIGYAIIPEADASIWMMKSASMPWPVWSSASAIRPRSSRKPNIAFWKWTARKLMITGRSISMMKKWISAVSASTPASCSAFKSNADLTADRSAPAPDILRRRLIIACLAEPHGACHHEDGSNRSLQECIHE